MSTELGAQRPSPLSSVMSPPLWRQLRWNLIATCVVLAVLPIAMFASIALPRTRDQVRRQIVSQLQSVAELKAQETTRWLANSQSALELLYAGQNQRERFVLLATTDLPTQVQVTTINRAFTDAVTAHAGFRGVFLYDVQGKVLASSDPAQIGTVVSHQPYYEQSLMGRYVQPPYYESGSNELTMVITRSVIDSSNRLVGILAGRLDLDTLAQIMAERTGLGTSGETYLVSAQGGYFLTPSRFEGYPPDRAYHSLGIDRALAGQQGSATYTNYRGVATFGVYRWMPDLRAGLLAEYDQAEALQGVNQERTVSLILGVLSVLVALILGLFAATRFSNPITVLSQAAARIAAGDLTARARLRQRNELGVLARAFNNMADQVQDLVGSLESRVAEHTRDLFLTLEVGQLATRTYQQAELLPRMVDFIRERFDLYYVQVFLLDGAQRDAILEAGTGEVGQQLLARKHRLSLHETSIVSRTVRSCRPVLVPNTDISPIHKPNPLLPDTRSEVAIPLIVGDQILGILDMQASQAETFREDNLPVFEAMASQLASALRAAQTYADVQTAIRRADIVNRRLTAGMWENYLGSLGDKGRLGYSYDLRAIEPLDQPLTRQDSRSGNGHGTQIARPVVLRHQAIGTITVGTGDDRPLTPEDLELVDTVADRIALALDQYRAFDETHDSQRLLQTIIDTTPDWIFTKDRDYRYLLVNQAFAEFYGQRTPEEMVGKDDYDLGTPVELIEGNPEKGIVGFRTDDRAVIERGETIRNPYDVVNYADGTLHVFDTTKLPLRDTEGNVIGLLGVAHDVTERIKAEQERAEREQLLRTLIDHMPDVVYVKDTEGRKLLSNKADARFMGVEDPDEVVGKTDFDFYPPEQAAQFLADDMQVIRSGEPVLDREEAFSVGSEPHWLLTTKVPLRDSQGRVFGLVGIGHDITERVKAEQERAEREQLLRSIIDTTPDWIFTKDRDYRFMLVNQAFAEFYGQRTPEEMAGRDDYDLGTPVELIEGNPEKGIVGFRTDDRAVIERGETIRNPYDVVNYADGTLHVFDTTKLPLRDTEGNVIGSLGVARDVTERLKAEEEIRKRASEMQTVAEVGAEAATLQDPERLLWNVVNLTKDRFGLYHAHIYLVDDTGRNLALTAGAGEAGRVMVEARHIIPLTDLRSVVVRAARGRRAVNVNDVTTTPDFLPNPLLPHTRSEMAIPLVAGTQLLGVLDVQSDQANRFTEEDTRVMTILASQIAVAVQNARQFEETQSSQQLLRTVIDNLPDLVYAKDTEGRKLLANRLDAQFMGLASSDEAIGKTDFDFYPREQAEAFFADDMRVIQSGEPVLNREEAFSVDGEVHRLLTTKVPLRDNRGRVIGLIGIGHDVTERVEAEEEVRRRASEMQAVAEVGTEVTSLQDPERLLWNVANLTKERFGLYHAHIYLVDEVRENLVLTAGAGEVGRVMVAAGHRIPLSNLRSVVVRAARGREAVIVNDVMATPDFLPNPLLPQTRSEMAIPLLVGKQVLGVLDVQGVQANRFTEEDTRVMMILASQIAVAVQNARQFEETQSSQQLLRLLIDNIPDHIYVKDRQGRFTIRNLAGARHMGAVSPEEVVGKTDFDYYPPDVAAIYRAAEEDILQSGQPLINQEEPIVDAEGHRGWILTTKMPMRNRQGEIIGLVGIGRDITGIKQAEQERAEREQLLRTLIDSLPDLVYVKDTESRYILSNVAHAQFMGFASPDEAVGKTVFDVYPPDLAPQYYADDRAVIEAGRPIEREEINVDSAGNRRWSWVTKVPLRDSLGRVMGLVGVARDITERRRSEETIRRYADEMETVAEVGTEAATSLEPNKLLQSVSDLTKERFGLYHAHIYLTDSAGKNLVLAAGAGQAGEVMVAAGHRILMTHENSLVARAARTRQAVVANNVTMAPDFLPNPLLPETKSEMAVPMIAGQRVIGVLDVQGDQIDRFTEEDMRIMTILASQIAVSVQNAELYAEQVEVADRLREVDRLKSEFLASMSHELRTPLNSIIGYAEVLLDGIDGELTDDMTEDIGAIHGSGKHLLNLINDILDLAKIEAGQMDLVTERVKLRPLAEDVINTSRVLLRDKPVDLLLDLPDDLPDLEGDALRLRQIVNNLLTNAIKFTEEGSIVLRASVYERDPRMVLIGVEDTGIGIDKEHLPVIFDRFRQVDQSHTRRASGTGLGLSITRQLVQMHGGDIWAESQLGSGSIFYFTIPATTEEVETA